MKKPLSLKDAVFIHETSHLDEFDKKKVTKVELAVMLSYRHWVQIKQNIQGLPHPSMSAFCLHPNALQILAQYKKKNCHKYTEVFKEIVIYSGSIYLIRIYKIVGEKFMKLEITKVPLGTKKHMDPKATVGGLMKLMKKITFGLEATLLPHYMHNGQYRLIDEFLEECS